MTRLTIEVYSDTLCPWCYIGKKFLDMAISDYTATHPDTEFEITWRPFLLYPKSKAAGTPKLAYYTATHGPSATAALLRKVEAVGAPLGIDFAWDGLSGSSAASHGLVLLAGSWARQSALLDLLFRGSFEEGRDISDRGFLAECAVAAGVVETEDEAVRFLEGQGAELWRRVEEEDRAARKDRGVKAVPSYLVQGRYFVGGMQRPEVFLELFKRVESR